MGVVVIWVQDLQVDVVLVCSKGLESYHPREGSLVRVVWRGPTRVFQSSEGSTSCRDSDVGVEVLDGGVQEETRLGEETGGRGVTGGGWSHELYGELRERTRHQDNPLTRVHREGTQSLQKTGLTCDL